MIGPHVIPAKLTQFANASVHITIAHVTVRVYQTAIVDMALHDRHNMLHAFVADAVADADLGLPAVHAEHPSHVDVVSEALESLMVHLTLVNLDRPGQLQVRQDQSLRVVRVGPPKQLEVLGARSCDKAHAL